MPLFVCMFDFFHIGAFYWRISLPIREVCIDFGSPLECNFGLRKHFNALRRMEMMEEMEKIKSISCE